LFDGVPVLSLAANETMSGVDHFLAASDGRLGKSLHEHPNAHAIIARSIKSRQRCGRDEFNVPGSSASAIRFFSVHPVGKKELLNLKEIPIWGLGFSCRDRGPGTGRSGRR
jgi:hypothetical protein